MEITQYTWSRQTVRKRWVSFEPFTPMEFLCQSASDPTSHIENQDVQSQLDVEDALSNVFESNAAEFLDRLKDIALWQMPTKQTRFNKMW